MLVRRGLALLAAAALTLSLHPVTSSADAPEAGTTTAGSAAAADKQFERLATYPVFQNVPVGTDPAAETVAEISAVSDDGKTVIYTDALGKRIGFVDITDPAAPKGTGTIELATLGAAGDSPTSVAVVGDYALLVIDETDGAFTTPKGRLDVIKLSDRTRVRSIDLGGQPDSIAVSKDKQYAAIAIENQRDEEATPEGGDEGDLPQLPAGGLQILKMNNSNPNTWTAHEVRLTKANGDPLDSFVAAGLDTPQDPEPEYVAINDANQLALTLQENNGIALIDLATRDITKVFNAGSPTITGVDVKKDGLFAPTGAVTGPREPDSIGWVSDTLVATANEGDWKGGSRGWTIFDTVSGEVVWDAGNTFENLATAYGLHNNDRAAKKGAEPEGLTIATVGGTRYAFVGSERSNFVAVYDLADPAAPRFVQVLPATNGPEGLIAIPGRDLFMVSSETDDASVGVRATVGVYQLGSTRPAFPSVVAEGDPTEIGIGWGALGALSPVPGRPGKLYAASDAAYKTGRIYTLDTTKAPAEITDVLEVTDPSGAKPAVDIEGLQARPEGGFWAAVEGTNGAGNQLLQLDSAGVIRETVPLPADIASHVGKWGFEGVTSVGSGDSEQLFLAIQRPLWVDPADPSKGTVDSPRIARIGRYDVTTKAWNWYVYRLEAASSAADWIGLSEITAIDDDTLAVIERDKLNGPAAAVKRIYVFDVPPAATPPALTQLDKKLAVDILPRLRALNGWTQEKLEGLTIGADHHVYAVTDNDGLVDATGETQLLRLGTVAKVFPEAVATRTSLRLAPSTVTWPTAGKAVVTVTGTGRVSGTVTVKEGTKTIGTGTLAGGSVVVSLAKLKPGAHRLTASYAGSASAAPSTSSPVTLTVRKAASATKLTVSKKQIRRGGTITATAVLAPRAATGIVEFRDNGRLVKKVRLVGGKAVARLRFTGVGLHKVRAVYLGDTYTNRSTSALVTIKVTR